jgi:predicted dinucleotide-binding enzyme
VGIIGAGQIGGTVAGLLTASGHEVALSNTRGREYALLFDRARPSASDDRLALPHAGDDPEAKHRVGRIIDDMGFDPVDLRPLALGGGLMEPGDEVFNRPREQRRFASPSRVNDERSTG